MDWFGVEPSRERIMSKMLQVPDVPGARREMHLKCKTLKRIMSVKNDVCLWTCWTVSEISK